MRDTTRNSCAQSIPVLQLLQGQGASILTFPILYDNLSDRQNGVVLALPIGSEELLSLLDLPTDILIGVFDYLTVDSLCCLSLACRHLYNLVSKFGWTSYLRSNPRFSSSLSCIDGVWDPYERVRYNTISERNWRSRNFAARPLSPPWSGKQRPGLAISRSRLVVSVGSYLDVYGFSAAPCYSGAPAVQLEARYSISIMNESQPRHDITAIAFLPGDGEDRRLLAGFADGRVMRVALPDAKASQRLLTPECETLYIEEDAIQSISISRRLSFSLSRSGKGVLRETNGEVASEINVDEKSWSSFMPNNGDPYVAIGTSSFMPLAIYPIYEAALSSLPSAALTSIKNPEWANMTVSAVYGITGPPPSFPGNPGQVVVSGWFDGGVRLFDLRIPSTSSFTSRSTRKAVPILSPIMALSDPWATESIYSISTGGGSGYTIAAGTARHSVVAFWDVRAPRAGWSVHAPGNDMSPVYAVELESSRLFGATQSRAFVYDFGPGVGMDTYPALPRANGRAHRRRNDASDSLKTEDDVHYAVTKYLHMNPMAGV